jgi:hypothetical protein
MLAGAAAVVGLTGCGAGSAGTASSSSAATSSAPPTDAAGLAALLKSGANTVRSAHLNMTVNAGTVSVVGSGDETAADGKLQSLDLTEDLPSAGKLRILLVGDKTYLQLPATLNKSGKPWVLVSAASTNPQVRQLASILDSVRQAASLGQFTTFSSVATVTAHEPATVDGAPTTHYSLKVDVSKLPDSLPGKQQLVTAGLSSLPVELWVDKQGRPVKVTEQLTAHGQTVSTQVTVSKINDPVTITPPPADQVSTD